MDKDPKKDAGTGGAQKENQRTNHLYRLSDLDDHEVKEDNSDVRGWVVNGKDGQKLGEVNDLIVDLNEMKVRYLDVSMDKEFAREGGEHHMLIPISLARLNQDSNEVLITNLGTDNINSYPVYKGDPISREYENSDHETIGYGIVDAPESAEEDNSHEYYDEQMFYGPRRTKNGDSDPNIPPTAFRKKDH